MCLCYLFSAKTARQLVNRKADFFTKRIDSNRFAQRIESIRIANWNALVQSASMWPIATDVVWSVCVSVY